MDGKEKLYFLVDAINDAKVLAPSGQPLIIDPMNELLRATMRKNEKSIGQNKRKLTARLPNCTLQTRNTI